jgi:hypothetical protein
LRLLTCSRLPAEESYCCPKLEPIGDERFRIGDPLPLKRPDGNEIATSIGGLEFAKPVFPRPCELVIVLTGHSKEDVPTGTEVWPVDGGEARNRT